MNHMSSCFPFLPVKAAMLTMRHHMMMLLQMMRRMMMLRHMMLPQALLPVWLSVHCRIQDPLSALLLIHRKNKD